MPSSATPVQLVDPDTGTPYRNKPTTAATPTYAVSTASANFATSQTTANTGAANQLIAARAGRGAVTIENLTGAQKVWLGPAGVTVATGFLLPAAVGASVTIPTSAAIFGISETAAQTVAILETF